MVSWCVPGPSSMTCVHHIFPSELWFLGLYLVLHVWHVYIRSFLLNYGFLVSSWSFIYMTCVHQIFPSELWFLGLYLVLHVWHVYIRSFLLNYGFLVSTWSFMYDMCTSDLSFWTMVSWSLPGPSCMTCVHQIFPSELWFLGLYLVLHVWHVYIRSFLLNYGFLVYLVPSCMTCVHQIFPSELWFLGLYLVLHVWHVYIRSFLLNYGFLVYLLLHVWPQIMYGPSHVYIRSFLLNYGFLVSTWFFMYDMCTSDLSFWTMVSWSLPGSSCMTCVHQIFPSELWFLGLYLVLHVWHVYIRSFLLNYGFLVSTWSSCMTCVHQIFPSERYFLGLPSSSCMTCVHQIFPSELWFLGLYLVLHVWHVYIRSFLLNYGFLVYLVLHVWHVYIRSFLLNYGFLVYLGSSCMTCVHQIFPSELWFLGLYLVLHVWHVYIRSFLLNYGFLVSTWSFMYDMCTSDLSFWTMVSWSTWSFMYDMCTSDLSFWTMVSWSTWFFMYDMYTSYLSFWTMVSWCTYLVLHVWHVYIRSFLLNYGFLVSTWSFMYDMCTSDLSFWNYGFLVYLVLHVWHVYIRSFLLNYGFLVSTWSFMYDMCTSDLSFWTMVSWSLPGPSCMTCVHQIFPSELHVWFLGLYLVLHVWHVYIRSFLLNYGFLVSTWSFMYDMCTSDLSFWTMVSWSTWSFIYDMCTSDLSFWTMVSWSLPGPSSMTCVHQIFPSELWFLGVYLILHVWHVYIRSLSELWFLGLYLVLHE